ncbi:MAG: glycosyl transferase, partial [Ilumatobacteraceae bacterium]
SGANFSMRRTLLDRVGGYDEFCGPGSRLRASDDTDLLHRVIRSGAKIRVDPQVEVVHTHGFRNQEAVVALSERYAFGNGGNYGRFLRRGDLMAGVTFTYREVHRLARAATSLDRSWLRAEIGGSRTRVRGFITGFRLPRDQGYVNGDAMRRLTYLANVLRRESVDT